MTSDEEWNLSQVPVPLNESVFQGCAGIETNLGSIMPTTIISSAYMANPPRILTSSQQTPLQEQELLLQAQVFSNMSAPTPPPRDRSLDNGGKNERLPRHTETNSKTKLNPRSKSQYHKRKENLQTTRGCNENAFFTAQADITTTTTTAMKGHMEYENRGDCMAPSPEQELAVAKRARRGDPQHTIPSLKATIRTLTEMSQEPILCQCGRLVKRTSSCVTPETGMTSIDVSIPQTSSSNQSQNKTGLVPVFALRQLIYSVEETFKRSIIFVRWKKQSDGSERLFSTLVPVQSNYQPSISEVYHALKAGAKWQSHHSKKHIFCISKCSVTSQTEVQNLAQLEDIDLVPLLVHMTHFVNERR